MKTYNDLEKKDKYKLDSIIDAAKSESDYNYGNYDSYGLCSKCSYFRVVESEFKVIIAKCEEFNIKLSTQNPVKRCTTFEKRGTMSLWDMKELAILIDIPKDKIGLIYDIKTIPTDEFRLILLTYVNIFLRSIFCFKD